MHLLSDILLIHEKCWNGSPRFCDNDIAISDNILLSKYGRYYMIPNEIRRAGLDALAQGLGAVGMVRFLQQNETGWGVYTEDRRKWLEKITFSEIKADLPKLKKSHPFASQAH